MKNSPFCLSPSMEPQCWAGSKADPGCKAIALQEKIRALEAFIETINADRLDLAGKLDTRGQPERQP